MEIYIIKNYCWYNEDTDQIQDDHRIPHLELTKTRKEVKKIAEKYGVKIMMAFSDWGLRAIFDVFGSINGGIACGL